jgi:hypothetical protein
MWDLLNEMWRRPLAAASSGWEALQAPGDAARNMEAAFARFMHGLAAPEEGRGAEEPLRQRPNETGAMMTAAQPIRTDNIPPDLQPDTAILPTIEEYLARGLALKRWWDIIELAGGPSDPFELERSFNQPTRSYGFFSEAPVGGVMLPIMGSVQEMFFDQTRAPASLGLDSAEWMRDQLREFVLKYFMRVSSFREPEAYVEASQPTPPPSLRYLDWCPAPRAERIGFGFTQLFNKRVGSDVIHHFPSYERYAISDQRLLGKLFEWMVLKVRIFDFSFRTRPFGDQGPELVFDLNEQSYLVAHEEFTNYKERHLPGVLADYGIGYAFIKSPTSGPFGYGPGEFDAAIELLNFRVYETGYVSVRMIFLVNRPTRVANVVVDPVNWSLSLADTLSLGFASPLFDSAKDIANRLPLRFTFDPISAYISGANLVSGGDASRMLCISTETLEKLFLLQHFKQHYQTIVGSMLTWRQIPNWLDTPSLPSWVISGLSQ